MGLDLDGRNGRGREGRGDDGKCSLSGGDRRETTGWEGSAHPRLMYQDLSYLSTYADTDGSVICCIP